MCLVNILVTNWEVGEGKSGAWFSFPFFEYTFFCYVNDIKIGWLCACALEGRGKGRGSVK